MLNPQLIVWWIWDYSCYGSCTGGGRIGKTVHVGRELGWLIVGGGGGGVVVDKGVREGLILIYPFFILIFLSQITYNNWLGDLFVCYRGTRIKVSIMYG